MASGFESKFNILQESPHDFQPSTPAPEEKTGVDRWVPSRYNIRATTEDGGMILWNVFRSSISVFKSPQVPAIKNLLSQKGIAAKPTGIVKYLVDRGYLISATANEYRQVQVAISQQQYRTDRLELILLASEDCNFRCRYCYENFERGTMLPEVRVGIKNLLQKRLKTLSSLQISWFGGEPLYGFAAVEDLAPFFAETAKQNDLFYRSNMTTNGYLLTPEVAEKLLAWKITNFQITVDGMEEDHNRSRPTRDGGESFSRVFSNLVALKSRSDEFSVSLRVNFDQDNAPGLAAFVELAEKHFAHDPRFVLNFYPVGRWGGAEDDKLNVCGGADADQIRRELKAEAYRRGLSIGTIKDVNYLGSEACYAARPYNFIIGAAGQVMKCTIALDKEDYNVVGTLQQDGELILDRDKMALWTEPAFENDTRCQKCVVLPICEGTHCPLVRLEENRSPCCGARSHSKAALLELLKFTRQPSKTKVVEA